MHIRIMTPRNAISTFGKTCLFLLTFVFPGALFLLSTANSIDSDSNQTKLQVWFPAFDLATIFASANEKKPNPSLASLVADPDGDNIDDLLDSDDDNDGIPDYIESGLTTICPTIGTPPFPVLDYTNCSSIAGGNLFSNIGTFQGTAIDMTVTNLTSGSIACGTNLLDGCNSGDNGFTLNNTGMGTTVDIAFYESGSSTPTSINWAIFLDDLDAVEGVAVDSANLFSYILNANNGMVVSYFSNKINFDSNHDNEDELTLFFLDVQSLSFEFTHTGTSRDVCFTSAGGYVPSNPTCVLEKIIGKDTDNDGIDNHFDLDSDNDGIFDLDEAGHSAADADDDGRIDGLPAAFGTNGLFDNLETVNDNDVLTYSVANSETSPDDTLDPYELDSDDDGCFDANEENIVDPEDDGIAGTGIPTVNGSGLVNGNTYATPTLNYWQNPLILACNEICGDAVDNDGDSLADCADADCCCSQSPTIAK